MTRLLLLAAILLSGIALAFVAAIWRLGVDAEQEVKHDQYRVTGDGTLVCLDCGARFGMDSAGSWEDTTRRTSG